ncbi:MAG: carbonic anhydrase [Fimbriimonadaceae bacterium]|nr:carbonic anhydrase [Fimbriimonadaceae bacterium]
MLQIALALILTPPTHGNPLDTSVPVPAVYEPSAAFDRLKEGNARFANDHAAHPHQDANRRSTVAGGQHPYAVVVTCADSRLSPEILFDEGLGDLFVIRVAGNVADRFALASIEYAVGHLDTKLIAVVGHSNCGAVKAAVDAGSIATRASNNHGHATDGDDNIAALVAEIMPAVRAAKNQPGDLLGNAVRTNVQFSIRRILEQSTPLRRGLMGSEIEFVGGVYDLKSGQVNWTEIRRGANRVALYTD